MPKTVFSGWWNTLPYHKGKGKGGPETTKGKAKVKEHTKDNIPK